METMLQKIEMLSDDDFIEIAGNQQGQAPKIVHLENMMLLSLLFCKANEENKVQKFMQMLIQNENQQKYGITYNDLNLKSYLLKMMDLSSLYYVNLVYIDNESHVSLYKDDKMYYYFVLSDFQSELFLDAQTRIYQ